MEKIFTNNSIWKKIVVAILIVMAFQILVSAPIVKADGPEDTAQDGDNLLWAGILMRPVMSLLLTIGDGTINLLHNVIMGQQQTLIPVNAETEWLSIIAGVLIGIIVFAAVIIASIATLGAIDALLAGTALSVGTIGMGTVVVAAGAGVVAGTAMYTATMPDTLQLPLYSYSAEEIFENSILLFNVNFFNPTSEEDLWVCYKEGGTVEVKIGDTGRAEDIKKDEGETIKKQYTECKDDIKKGKIQPEYYFLYKDGVKDEGHEVKTSPQIPARELMSVISRWYVAIRNICIVIMLSVLIYIGIRMMLTSVANEKAKYKEMLKDWIVGLCLLFVVHYIMAFSVVIVEKITEVVKTGIIENQMIYEIGDVYDGKLVKTAETLGFTEENKHIIDGKDDEGKDIKVLMYPTNLMGKIRLEMQAKDEMQTGKYIGLVICFLMLVIFTVVFTFTYLKRLLHMAFLTIIAPLVSMTYCIDKVNDGKAQGFNIWIKEYIFNLLIQPVHLILYYILITSAYELASTNILYSIVAIGFLIPAEKLLRSLFGFEKAKTPPSLMGASMMGTMAMNAMNGLKRIGPSDKRKGSKDTDAIEGEKGITMAENLGGDVNPAEALSNEIGETDDISETPERLTEGRENREEGEDSNPRWATQEIQDRMDYIDSQEQALNDLSPNELSGNSEYFNAYLRQKERLQNMRRDALLENYRANRIRMANLDNSGQENVEGDRARFTSPNNGAVARARQQNRISNNQQHSDSLRDRIRRVGRYTKSKMGKSAIKGAKTLGRTVARGAVSAPLIAGGIIAGGAISAATTGDLGKTAQGMVAGGAAGAGLGSGISNYGENAGNATIDFVHGAEDAWHGDNPERERRKQERQVNRTLKNVEVRNTISNKLGEKRLKQLEESGDLKKYVENGFQDGKDIVDLVQLQDRTQLSTDAAIGIGKLHRDVADGKDTTIMKKRSDVVKTTQGYYSREATNGDENMASKLTDKTMEYMDELSRIKYNHD